MMFFQVMWHSNDKLHWKEVTFIFQLLFTELGFILIMRFFVL